VHSGIIFELCINFSLGCFAGEFALGIVVGLSPLQINRLALDHACKETLYIEHFFFFFPPHIGKTAAIESEKGLLIRTRESFQY